MYLKIFFIAVRLNSGHFFKQRTLTDNFVPLIDVIGARKEDPSPDHFSHDATDRPDVDVLLVTHTKDHL